MVFRKPPGVTWLGHSVLAFAVNEVAKPPVNPMVAITVRTPKVLELVRRQYIFVMSHTFKSRPGVTMIAA
jgi:hypothetical protein